MTAKKTTTEDAGVVPGTDAPAVDPVKGPEGVQPAAEPQVTPAEWETEGEPKSQAEFEKVEINKNVIAFTPENSTFGKGGAQSHSKDKGDDGK